MRSGLNTPARPPSGPRRQLTMLEESRRAPGGVPVVVRCWGAALKLAKRSAQGEEKIVQLRERLDHRIRRPGAGSVESFLRGIELVHDQQRLATLFLECHRDDRPTLTTFLVGRSEEHTSELQSLAYLVCRLLL